MDFVTAALKDAEKALSSALADPALLEGIEKSITKMLETLKSGAKIMACGNGGSMCDSHHFVQELTGRYRKDRPPIAAVGMGEMGHATCVGNDYGFDYVFSRQVEALGRRGDCLLAVSTSGNSPNVLLAIEKARERGLVTVGLTGKDGGKVKGMVDVPLVVPHQVTDRIQEVHIKIIHIFIEGIERGLYPHLYS